MIRPMMPYHVVIPRREALSLWPNIDTFTLNHGRNTNTTDSTAAKSAIRAIVFLVSIAGFE